MALGWRAPYDRHLAGVGTSAGGRAPGESSPHQSSDLHVGSGNASDGDERGGGLSNDTMRAPRLLDRVRSAIRVRHYSIRTEQAYVQ